MRDSAAEPVIPAEARSQTHSPGASLDTGSRRYDRHAVQGRCA
jgi:hypothetical protein